MEQENDAQIGNLAGKVSQLRELSIQIGGHVREDNRLLSDLDGSFDSTGGLLGGTMKRCALVPRRRATASGMHDARARPRVRTGAAGSAGSPAPRTAGT